MALALAVSTLAVLLGLLLGLAPAASRRALGPLRTLTVSAVGAVILGHLLPEALSTLKSVGLLVFAAGLALPRWLARAASLFQRDRGDPAGGGSATGLALAFGFWGLLVHHVGDGLALGAYARMGQVTDHVAPDVLLALALHTVPLVAVVAAGYQRALGRRAAVVRSVALAGASALGIFATGLATPAKIHELNAWVAAGVAGLLLHALTHDLTDDPPLGHGARLIDLGCAAAGAVLVVLGLGVGEADHGAPEVAIAAELWSTLEAAAPLVLIGLFVGVVADSWFKRRAGPAEGAFRGAETLSPESFLLSLGLMGPFFAWTRHLIAILPVLLRRDWRTIRDSKVGFAGRLDARVDQVGVWVVIGVLVAAVIAACIPDQALIGLGGSWLALPLVLIWSISVPVHGAALPLIAAALGQKGLSASIVLLLALLPPAADRLGAPRGFLGFGLVAVLGAAAGPWLRLESAGIDPILGRAAAVLFTALVLRRIYEFGLRGFLAPLAPAERVAGR